MLDKKRKKEKKKGLNICIGLVARLAFCVSSFLFIFGPTTILLVWQAQSSGPLSCLTNHPAGCRVLVEHYCDATENGQSRWRRKPVGAWDYLFVCKYVRVYVYVYVQVCMHVYVVKLVCECFCFFFLANVHSFCAFFSVGICCIYVLGLAISYCLIFDFAQRSHNVN